MATIFNDLLIMYGLENNANLQPMLLNTPLKTPPGYIVREGDGRREGEERRGKERGEKGRKG